MTGGRFPRLFALTGASDGIGKIIDNNVCKGLQGRASRETVTEHQCNAPRCVRDRQRLRHQHAVAKSTVHAPDYASHQGIQIPWPQCHKAMNSMGVLQTKGLWEMGSPLIPMA